MLVLCSLLFVIVKLLLFEKASSAFEVLFVVWCFSYI